MGTKTSSNDTSTNSTQDGQGKAERYERSVRERSVVTKVFSELLNLRHSSHRRYWMFRATGRSFAEFYAVGMDQVATKNPENATGRPEQKVFQLEYLQSQGLNPCDKMLDFGCGTGSAAVNFVQYLDEGCYTGADISERCVETARMRMAQQTLAGKHPQFFHLPGGSTEPLQGHQYDVIWAQSVLTHMPPDDIALMLERIAPLMHSESRFFATFAFTDGKPLHHKHVDWYYNPEFFTDVVTGTPLECSFHDDWHHPTSTIDRMVCFRPRRS